MIPDIINTFESAWLTDKVIKQIKSQKQYCYRLNIIWRQSVFAINHISDEKSRASAIKFKDHRTILKTIDMAIGEGVNTFMCTTHNCMANVYFNKATPQKISI